MRQRYLAMILAVLGCVLVLLVYRRGIEPTLVVEAQVRRDQIQSDTPISPKKIQRVVYRYALVPTGVHSLSDFYSALTDPAVLQAYSGVDVGLLHISHLKTPLCGYVAFKRDGFVQWTTHCIAIKAGEEILTDGHTMILARCGNLVSLMPQGPAGSPEVKISTLDDAFPPVAPAAPSVASAGPDVTPGAAAPGSVSTPTFATPGTTTTAVVVAPPAGLPCCGGGVSIAPPPNPKHPVSMVDGDDNSLLLLAALMLLLGGVSVVALGGGRAKHSPLN